MLRSRIQHRSLAQTFVKHGFTNGTMRLLTQKPHIPIATLTSFFSTFPTTITNHSTFKTPALTSHFSTMAPAAHYYADTKAPVTPLEVKQHFELLADNDKLYAHHMSRYEN